MLGCFNNAQLPYDQLVDLEPADSRASHHEPADGQGAKCKSAESEGADGDGGESASGSFRQARGGDWH